MFFMVSEYTVLQSILSAGILVGVILLGVVLTFAVSKILSKTILKGLPTSFVLELPPYRKPQIGKVVVRSIFDRTLSVLGRAVTVAAPAGILIWLMANITVGETSLLLQISAFLDPFARLLGLDGIILFAFILGFPANEIVIPIIIMSYLNTNKIVSFQNLEDLKLLLTANGWTIVTAISTMLFCLVHWPCSTACLTIRKEAGGTKWMVLAILIPTLLGFFMCFTFATAARCFL
jgi:ferrous iron transport protein B